MPTGSTTTPNTMGSFAWRAGRPRSMALAAHRSTRVCAPPTRRQAGGLLLIVGTRPVMATVCPSTAEFVHPIEERLQRDRLLGMRAWHEHADTAHARCRRLCSQQRRVAREVAAESEHQKSSLVQSITLSARSRMDRGTVMPRAFAVFRLITSSNRVGCSTGRSAGLAPLRILSTNWAERRSASASDAL